MAASGLYFPVPMHTSRVQEQGSCLSSLNMSGIGKWKRKKKSSFHFSALCATPSNHPPNHLLEAPLPGEISHALMLMNLSLNLSREVYCDGCFDFTIIINHNDENKKCLSSYVEINSFGIGQATCREGVRPREI